MSETTSTIRKFMPSDLNSCLNVFDSNVPKFFAEAERADFESFLRSPPGLYFVMEIDSALVGCGGWAIDKADANAAALTWGMVMQCMHKRGLGRQLLKFRLQSIRSDCGIQKIVVRTSQHSDQFFQRFGFTEIHRLANGFAPGIDHIHMEMTKSV